ncbi:hypothetical protein CAJ82_23520, partial [Salmonella enterica subsp. enterica serovar Typhi]|nr:hypothetical protein [Salmonella enterica subsp. enterica serovar Typhi]
ALGIFVKEKGKVRELQLGEVVTGPTEYLMSKLRVIPELPKTFEVATPEKEGDSNPKRRHRKGSENE